MKKYIRTAALLAVSCIALFALSGCGQSQIVNEANGSVMREVASNGLGTIYVVEIDGEEYVVVLGVYKAAICPKTK